MDHLALFLASIDRIIKLLEEFRQDRRTLFTQLIEPLAKDFAPVAENYMLIFTRLGQDAAKAADENEFREAFARFSEQRLEFEQARRRIEILAETYAKRFGKDDAQEFFAKRMASSTATARVEVCRGHFRTGWKGTSAVEFRLSGNSTRCPASRGSTGGCRRRHQRLAQAASTIYGRCSRTESILNFAKTLAIVCPPNYRRIEQSASGKPKSLRNC